MAKIRTRYKSQTTEAAGAELVYPNLLNQQFGKTETNLIWLFDITYVCVNAAWDCLCSAEQYRSE